MFDSWPFRQRSRDKGAAVKSFKAYHVNRSQSALRKGEVEWSEKGEEEGPEEAW